MLCKTFQIKYRNDNILDLLDSGGKLDHEPRLYEVEMAAQMGIPFDHHWYSMPKEAREQLIAGKLARISIENVMARVK